MGRKGLQGARVEWSRMADPVRGASEDEQALTPSPLSVVALPAQAQAARPDTALSHLESHFSGQEAEGGL